MSKTQLLEEAGRVGLVVHHKWTVEEIKAAIQEHRMNDPNAHPSHKMKSVTQLNMPELKLKAAELGISAKYKGWEFGEIPNQYGMWAAREVRMSANPHVELVRFARWWESEQHRHHYGTPIEENSVDNTQSPIVPRTGSARAGYNKDLPPGATPVTYQDEQEDIGQLRLRQGRDERDGVRGGSQGAGGDSRAGGQACGAQGQGEGDGGHSPQEVIDEEWSPRGFLAPPRDRNDCEEQRQERGIDYDDQELPPGDDSRLLRGNVRRLPPQHAEREDQYKHISAAILEVRPVSTGKGAAKGMRRPSSIRRS